MLGASVAYASFRMRFLKSNLVAITSYAPRQLKWKIQTSFSADIATCSLHE